MTTKHRTTSKGRSRCRQKYLRTTCDWNFWLYIWKRWKRSIILFFFFFLMILPLLKLKSNFWETIKLFHSLYIKIIKKKSGPPAPHSIFGKYEDKDKIKKIIYIWKSTQYYKQFLAIKYVFMMNVNYLTVEFQI